LTRGIEVAFKDEHRNGRALLTDVESVDAFVGELLNERHDQNCALVFSMDRPLLPSGVFDHELAVGVDRTAGVGVATLRLDHANVSSQGTHNRGIVEYMLMGHAREFMPGSEIPIESICRIVKEFLLNGGNRPTCVEWQEEEF
jgi:hypothetical protein